MVKIYLPVEDEDIEFGSGMGYSLDHDKDDVHSDIHFEQFMDRRLNSMVLRWMFTLTFCDMTVVEELIKSDVNFCISSAK